MQDCNPFAPDCYHKVSDFIASGGQTCIVRIQLHPLARNAMVGYVLTTDKVISRASTFYKDSYHTHTCEPEATLCVTFEIVGAIWIGACVAASDCEIVICHVYLEIETAVLFLYLYYVTLSVNTTLCCKSTDQ